MSGLFFSGAGLRRANIFGCAIISLRSSVNFLDSIIFITLAFAGTVANAVLVNMIISQYLVKIILVLADTPFCYLAVRWARKEGVTADER